MKQEGHPREVRLNDKGANQDVDKSIVGANSKSGEYLEGRNLRVSSVKSERLAAEKIGGELLVHTNTLPGDYVSILSESVNDNKIEFWVDSNGIEDPVIIIDGVIVAKSPGLPFLIDFPLQHDINESCIGGEIFVTDNNTVPLIFSLQDLLDSLVNNPTKYFANFNINLYTVNLNIDLSIPVFKELVDIGGNNGLPVGSYSYSFRYVTNEGDRTDFTPSTPLIPVIENFSTSGPTFPFSRTFGGPANIGNKTNFGIKIKFRINNASNFDFIEIRRQAFNLGIGGTGTPDSFIVGKIDISNGEISVKEFIDPQDSNVDDAISEEDEINKLAAIKRAKGIRYHDKRLVLMNVEFESKDSDALTFDTINGEAGVPVVKALGKIGHKDPFHHTYHKRSMSGEKFGYAAVLYDSIGATSFAKQIPGLENFEFPNRRDVISPDGLLHSYEGTPQSATNVGTVENTFEIFDLEDAVNKTDLCSYKNILEDKGVVQNVGKTRAACSLPGCPEDFGAFVSVKEIGYLPYKPVSKDDIDVSGLNYQVNINVDKGGGSEEDYNPLGFAPNYYTNGLAIGGVSNIPSFAKAFSIVRTEAAGRVIASGIGMYSLVEGEFDFVGNSALLSKKRDKLWFHSADLESVNANLVDSIKENPNDFKIQIVSALGFFSEIYGYENNTFDFDRDRTIDMITYARILHDEGQINPTEHSAMGISGFGKRWVAHNRYRNSDAAMGGVFGGDGNTLIDIGAFTEVLFNDTAYFEIDLNTDVYNREFIGGNSEKDFDDDGMKDWTEPMYIVNIINVGAEVGDPSIQNYKSTGHFQKIESTLGIGNNLANQTFELVDERWEDCIPDLSSTGSFANTNSFVYLIDALGVPKAWMNVTFKTPSQITVIINDINTNGFHVPAPGIQVFGVYTHTNSNNRDFNIIFSIAGFFPTPDDTITIRYDTTRPISIFGGDSIVGEQIFCPLDRRNNNDEEVELQFVFNAGFPFRTYGMNKRHFVPRDGSATFNKVQDNSETNLGFIRQLVVMFHAESRAAINYTHNIKFDRKNQAMPIINYVMRPNKWNTFDLENNDVRIEYEEDYGVDESTTWPRGGFRWIQNVNLDYTFDGLLQFFSRPKFGFEEVELFCTAVIWSIPRAVNVQDSPGLKTFTTANRLDIADDQGEIKKAYDATTGGKGENLYAITEKGVCLLLTKKSILSNIDSDDLTTVASDQFISGEYWISKEIGSDDEFWRGMGERNIGFLVEKGTIEKEVLFFPNKDSVFSLIDNQIKDIARAKYHSRLKPFLNGVKPGYESFMTGVINKNNNEYWLDIEGIVPSGEIQEGGDILIEGPDRKLFAFGNENGLWEGTFDYKFDQYFMSDSRVFGSRDLQTFILEEGFIINNQQIVYELTTVFSPGNMSLEKEFIRIGIQTGKRGTMKPTRIEFYDEEMTLLCSLDQLNQGSLFLKQYDGWEQFIGRKDLAASNDRDRVQSRTLVVKIIHDEAEDFKVVSTTIQYKIIK